MMPTTAEKRARFAELHAAPGCFVIPNPFDIGSAKYLASLGFPALASTSAGMAFAAGKGDGAVDRAYALSHLRDLAEATDLPLNADFEAGFAHDPRACTRARGFASAPASPGFSIEDYTGDPRRAPLRSERGGRPIARGARRDQRQRRKGSAHRAAARRSCARRAALPRRCGALPLMRRRAPTCFTRRWCRTAEEVAEVVRVAGKLPVNVLAGWPGFTKSQLEDLGVKRISVGGALARAAWGGFMRAAKDIAENGRFDAFADLPTMGDITAAFADKG